MGAGGTVHGCLRERYKVFVYVPGWGRDVWGSGCKAIKNPLAREPKRVGIKEFGGDLLSHTVARAVPSALESLTSVFEMGTGGTSLLWPPKI